jgi:hypothetical protein
MRHYGDRQAPWVKLHSDWLDNYAFVRLSDPQKLGLMLLWMYANRCGNAIPDDPEYLQWKLAMGTGLDLDALVAAGFVKRVKAGEKAEPRPPKVGPAKRPVRARRPSPRPQPIIPADSHSQEPEADDDEPSAAELVRRHAATLEAMLDDE